MVTVGVDSINTRILLEEISQVTADSLTPHLSPLSSVSRGDSPRPRETVLLLLPSAGLLRGKTAVVVLLCLMFYMAVRLLPLPPGAGLHGNHQQLRELELSVAAAH